MISHKGVIRQKVYELKNSWSNLKKNNGSVNSFCIQWHADKK